MGSHYAPAARREEVPASRVTIGRRSITRTPFHLRLRLLKKLKWLPAVGLMIRRLEERLLVQVVFRLLRGLKKDRTSLRLLIGH
jgi:hypothetical protein